HHRGPLSKVSFFHLFRTLGYKNRYIRVPDGHFWIEGDHHGHSLDSNSFGPVRTPPSAVTLIIMASLVKSLSCVGLFNQSMRHYMD
uniref:Peptidase S26 domain-containing protein n=1 Tax=Amphilophus citrinellus TaxID=61819 RepID=A0A3Q0T469_AMPCI